jgi:hypothetical protein
MLILISDAGTSAVKNQNIEVFFCKIPFDLRVRHLFRGSMNYKYYHIPCTNFRYNISPVVISGIGEFHCQVATRMIHGSMFHGTFNLVSRQTTALGVE